MIEFGIRFHRSSNRLSGIPSNCRTTIRCGGIAISYWRGRRWTWKGKQLRRRRQNWGDFWFPIRRCKRKCMPMVRHQLYLHDHEAFIKIGHKHLSNLVDEVSRQLTTENKWSPIVLFASCICRLHKVAKKIHACVDWHEQYQRDYIVHAEEHCY